MRMTKDQMHGIIDRMIDEIGINDPASIAFAIIQDAAEESRGDNRDEARALKGMMSRVQEAFDEEYRVLMGGEGNTYIAP